MFADENHCTKLFNLIVTCQGITQNKIRHPEADVYTHLIQCYNLAKNKFKKPYNNEDKEFILAALLHDIGKIKQPRDHDKHGADMLNKLNFIPKKTIWLVKHHINIEIWLTKGIGNWFYKTNKHDLYLLKELHKIDNLGRDPNTFPRLNINEFKHIFYNGK